MRGAVIGDRFEVERMIAEGGMGVIYRAVDRHTDGDAAVKVLRAVDAASSERFAREAQILAELQHPCIVRYLTHGRTDAGELFLAMEWLDGEDLAHLLQARELTVAETLTMVGRVAAALAAAHTRGIVHRDIKPANLFLADYRIDRARLLDFGVARAPRLSDLTATGALVGTPRYMAPEQARGDRRIDARADVFALGTVLYRCLSGRHAFTGDATADLLDQILHRDPPALAALRPELPAPLSDLCARMLEKDPARRPRDAAAVLAELLLFDATAAIAGQSSPRPASLELTGEESVVSCVLALATAEPGERVATLAAAHGGSVGRAAALTTITFAGPRPATDQAKLAARCALGLRREYPELPMAAAMGRRGAAERARGLLGEGNAIRIDAALAGLLDARFQVSGLVLAGEAPGDDEARPLLGKPTPFLGREAELGQLRALLDADDATARVVLVSAPAGAGKSRLRLELCRGRQAWLGRGEPLHAGAPFALLGSAIRRAAGIFGDEPLALRRRLLAERVARHLPGERAGGVAELIGELAGVPFPAEESVPLRAARRDPSLMAERLRAAWVEWLAAETAAAPVLLVLEDLHWGDLPTVKLVDHALAALADRPLFVLALGRPEAHDLFPRLWAERGLLQIHLGALPRRSAERLVRQALPGASAEDVAAVVERGAGNPFYLEELIRHVAAEGARSFPDTVLAMVGARFAQLGADERRTLRAASVFGEVFWAAGVAALTGGEPRLDELVAAELVVRRHDPRLAGQAEYGFGHSLLREGAYALLTDEDRALGHRLAGEWLERAGEGEALVLAEHFERGGDAGRAAASFARAAAQALAGADPAGALARAGRGVDCGAVGELLGELRLVQAQAQRSLGDYQRTVEAGRAAKDLLRPGGDAWFRAIAEAALASAMRGQADAVAALAEEALAAAPDPLSSAAVITFSRIAIQCGIGRGPRALFDTLIARIQPLPAHLESDPGVAGIVAEALCYRAGFAGRPEEGYLQMQRAEALSRAAGDARNACMQGTQLATFEYSVGDLEACVARAEALIAELTALRIPVVVWFAQLARCIALTNLGRAAEALAVADAVLAAAPPRSVFAVVFTSMRVRALAATGRAAEAEAATRATVAQLEINQFTRWGIYNLTYFLIGHGKAEEALALLDRVPPEVPVGEMSVYFWPADAHLARIQAYLALGRREDARAEAGRARAWIAERVEAGLSAENYARCARRNPAIAALLRHHDELR